MIQRLADVPFEIRMERAIELGDPDVIAVAMFPGDAAAVFDDAPTYAGRCRHGHPWNEENTHVRPNGWRVCLACERERSRRRATAGEWK